jgi:uracil-DNA glycosylase
VTSGGAMFRVAFAPTWEGWRAEARAQLRAGRPPERVEWHPAGEGREAAEPELFAAAVAPGSDAEPACAAPSPAVPRVPPGFLELGEAVACHRAPERWALLYRALWRLTNGERHLLEVAVDADVRRLRAMERAVRRASHKMKAFVRFRATGGADDPYVAWFEPEQRVVERVAPFFARRFTGMRWSILTPERCAHWDGTELSFSPGAPRSAAPESDHLEDLWRTYYAHIFNPARLNPRAMRAELPVGYWKNLPEAELIPTLQRDAAARTRRMVAGLSTAESEPALRPSHAASASAKASASSQSAIGTSGRLAPRVSARRA